MTLVTRIRKALLRIGTWVRIVHVAPSTKGTGTVIASIEHGTRVRTMSLNVNEDPAKTHMLDALLLDKVQ